MASDPPPARPEGNGALVPAAVNEEPGNMMPPVRGHAGRGHPRPGRHRHGGQRGGGSGGGGGGHMRYMEQHPAGRGVGGGVMMGGRPDFVPGFDSGPMGHPMMGMRMGMPPALPGLAGLPGPHMPHIPMPPLGRGKSRGTQNDYSQHFVDTGYRPQNFIRDMDMGERFEEYPKLKELIARKDEIVAKSATPPMYLHLDLKKEPLSVELLGTKFDVILIDPPWEEYVRRAPGVGDGLEWWTAAEIMALRIEAIADTPSFVFLWVGDAEGLDHGRMCLKKWGFRRCEDISWVKTNRDKPDSPWGHTTDTLFQHSKEHCLMGIRGTVRRSTDGHIIHANIDTDVILSEQPPFGSTEKPEEMYSIIEHFALGRRRLELFGGDRNIRAGWLTLGNGLTSSNFNKEVYVSHFSGPDGRVWHSTGRGNPPPNAPHLVATTPEIEALRPKSPPHRASTAVNSTAPAPPPAQTAAPVSGPSTLATAPPVPDQPQGPPGLTRDANPAMLAQGQPPHPMSAALQPVTLTQAEGMPSSAVPLPDHRPLAKRPLAETLDSERDHRTQSRINERPP